MFVWSAAPGSSPTAPAQAAARICLKPFRMPPSLPAAFAASFRRYVAAAVVLMLVAIGLAPRAQAFALDDVVKRATQLAKSAYQAPVDKLPKPLKDLAYDDYRDIRFKAEDALWHGEKLPFELMFFHPGRHYGEPVRINEIVGRKVTAVRFDPAQYDYGRNQFSAEDLKGLSGHAGFRVHFPINRPDYKDEVVVFLGASYFRAVGKDQIYGLSARGLAIDVATAQGEEFPRFTEFWVEKPGPKATRLTIFALMDSRRMTGAYRFELVPGAETVMNVQSVLVPRDAVEKLGVAPLTSMYLFGENQPGRDDYRPEVHDSDGLSVQTGEGEWIWRPLVNPQRLLVTSFGTTDPKGFGLMQRDRAFADYEDPEAMYDRRPSAWVEPVGRWGPGRVELVQIPTPDETNDNIVAYWVPEKAPAANQPYPLNYRLRWQGASDKRPPTAWVVQSRRGRGFVRQPDGNIKFVVDFDGPAIRPLEPDAALEAYVNVGAGGELVEQNLFRNRANGTWRVTVRLKRPDPTKPVELRALLKLKDAVVSETWSYILPPQLEK